MAGFFKQMSLQKQTSFCVFVMLYMYDIISAQNTITNHSEYQEYRATRNKLVDGLCVLVGQVETRNGNLAQEFQLFNHWNNSAYAQARRDIVDLQATLNEFEAENTTSFTAPLNVETFNTAALEWIRTMDKIDELTRIDELITTSVGSLNNSGCSISTNERQCNWLNNHVLNNCSALNAIQCGVRQNFTICNERGMEPLCGQQMCSAMGYA